jgi:hypothetical protein
VLNEALRIHGGPAWRVFQVRRCRLLSLISSSSRSILAVRRLLVLICWRQELEHRARDKYSAENQGVCAWLLEAQAQQSQTEEQARAAEQRAKEADELNATLDAKVAALDIAEDRLLQEHTARQGAEGQLQQERAALADARSALERERTAGEAAQKSLEERNVEFLKLEGELVVLSITSASQKQALKEQSDTVNGLQQAVEAERRALEVERKQVEGRSLFVFCFADIPLVGLSPFMISLLLATFRPAHRAGARDRPCRGAAGLLELLRAGAAGAACCGPRDLPGRGGGRGAGWELAGQPPARPWRARLQAHTAGAAPRRPEGPRSGAISL